MQIWKWLLQKIQQYKLRKKIKQLKRKDPFTYNH